MAFFLLIWSLLVIAAISIACALVWTIFCFIVALIIGSLGINIENPILAILYLIGAVATIIKGNILFFTAAYHAFDATVT